MAQLKTSFISKITLFLAAATLSLSAMAADFNQTQRLANQGNVGAQFGLGYAYSTGKGVRQDYAKAFEWYQKAANQGFANAQYNLGVMYNNGKGVRQDYVVAKEWFGKSCDNGNQKGCDVYRFLNQR